MRIVVVCNHPGGVNSLRPVVQKLIHEKHNIFIVSSKLNIDDFRSFQCEVLFLDRPIALHGAENVLNSFSPNLLLTGTSEPEDEIVGRLESFFIKASKKLDIKSLSVMDCWHKYRDRFSLSNKNKLDAVPDVICIIDERSKIEMIEEGFREETLCVTGNPHWDRLPEIKRSLRKVNLSRIRRRCGIMKGRRNILFISQPISERSYAGLEYSEIDVSRQLVKLVREVPSLRDVDLLIKPHPREFEGKFDDAFRGIDKARIRLVENVNLYHIAYASNFIVGMFSMVLPEFHLLGMNTLSYQPVKSRENIIDIGLPQNTKFTMPQLENWLSSEDKACETPLNSLDCTEQVLNCIYRFQGTTKLCSGKLP